LSRTARKPPRCAARAEAERGEIQQMRSDRHARLVGGARMVEQQIAVVHRQRQRAAGRQLPPDHRLDMGHHRPQRRHRQMHVDETLVVRAVGAEERLVELEQHHRARPHRELAAAVHHQRRTAAGVARQAIAVIIGREHLAMVAPHSDEGAVTAPDQGRADMDGVHRGAERHIGRRIEFAGVGKMLEQFRKPQKPLPLIKPLRQHVGGQHFLDDSHRNALDAKQ
jgi:hypothetical protein